MRMRTDLLDQTTLAVLGRQITSHIVSISSEPAFEARLLLAHVLAQTPTWITAHPETHLTPAQQKVIAELVERRAAGEPLPYILGHWEFFGLDLIVSPAVLIPRSETELLVEHALAWLRSRSAGQRAADIGAGSGCIAAGIMKNISNQRVFLCDISLPALEIARQNLLRHLLHGQALILQTDLLSCFAPASLDLVCANLPYIPTQKLQALPIFGREPTVALDGGADGLEVIRRLLEQAASVLAPGGMLLLEIEAGQGGAAQKAAQQVFPLANVSLWQDLSQKDRLVKIQN